MVESFDGSVGNYSGGQSYTTLAATVEISGIAEPQSTVYLRQDGQLVANTTASTSIKSYSGDGSYIVSEKGVSAYYDYNYSQLKISSGSGYRYLLSLLSPDHILWVGDKLLLLKKYSNGVSFVGLLNTDTGDMQSIDTSSTTLTTTIRSLVYFDEAESVLYFLGYDEFNEALFRWDLSGGAVDKLDLAISIASSTTVSKSFDGRYVALPIGNSTNDIITIRLIDLENSSIENVEIPGVFTAASSSNVLPVWSHNDHAFYFSKLGDYGKYVIVKYDMATEQTSAVQSDSEYDLRPFDVADDGSLLASRSSSSVLSLYLLDLPSQTSNLLYERDYQNLVSANLLVGNMLALKTSTSSSQLLVPVGYYRFSDVSLESGDNHFETIAYDASNNESEASKSIVVTRNDPDRADLTVRSELLPWYPTANMPAKLTVTIRNGGLVLSEPTQLSGYVQSPSGVKTMLANALSVPSLEPGSEHQLAFEFTPQELGEYSAVMNVDPLASVVESEEGNNVFNLSFDVVEIAAPFVKVQVSPNNGKLEFASAADIAGSVSVTNAGTLFSGKLKVTVVDANDYLVEDLADFEVSKVLTGATITKPYIWNTQSYLAGDYKVRVALENLSGELISSATAGFKIIQDLHFISSVRLYLPAFAANKPVEISGTVVNTGGNAILDGAEVFFTVASLAGDVIYSTSQPIGQILPGSSTQLSSTWNTGNYQPGAYVVKMVVLPDNNSLTAQTSMANLTILQGAPQLRAKLLDGPSVFGKGDPIDLALEIANLGNSALSDISINLTLTSLQNGSAIAQTTQTLNLGYEEIANVFATLASSNIPLGQYQAVLSYQVNVLGIHYQSILEKLTIDLVDTTAPDIAIIEPANGSLMSSKRKNIVVQAQDADTGVVSASVAFDEAEFVDMQDASNLGSGFYQASLSGLVDGVHRIRVLATDKAQNKSTPVELSIEVDNTPPVVQYSGVTSGTLYNHIVTPIVVANDANLETLELTLNGAEFNSGTSVSGDGDYRLTVIATDRAGNVTSDVALFGIDTVAAQITITGVSNGATYLGGVTPVIQIQDDNILNVAISLNGETFVSGTEITNFGDYILLVSVEDTAGNVAQKSVEFTLRQAAPDAPAVTAPVDSATVNNNILTVVGNAEAETTLVLQNLTNGTSYSIAVDAQGAFSLENVQLVQGVNQLEFWVQDSSGTSSVTTQLTVNYEPQHEVELSNNIAGTPAVIIWATDINRNYHPQCSVGQHGNHTSSYPYYDIDLEATIELIERAYDEAGIEYLLVRSPEAFRYALRTQKYNVINLINLQDAYSLPTHFEGEQGMEMRAAVLSGTGLVLNFTRAYSFYILRDMLKADVAGQTTSNVVNLDGEVFGSNSVPWVLSDTGLNVILEGATGFGNMNYQYYGCSQATCNQPAVVTNHYGLGNAALVPFNLPDAGDTPEVKQFIVNLAKFAAPDNVITLPDTTYRMDWDINGLDGFSSLVINQNLPNGFKYSGLSSGGSNTGTNGMWMFNGLSSDVLSFNALISTPNSLTNASVLTEGYDTVINSSNLLFEDSLSIGINATLGQMQSNLLMQVNSLNTNSSNSWRKANALQRINQAFGLTRQNESDSNLAILYILLAIDDLRYIDNSDQILVLASQIIRSYQSRWADQHY